MSGGERKCSRECELIQSTGLGPLLGSLLAVGFYKLIKLLEYETANPGQDFNDKEAEVFNVDEDTAATAKDVARPNIAIGRSEYIADDNGIHMSQDIRKSQGHPPKAPADYSRPSAVAEEENQDIGQTLKDPNGGLDEKREDSAAFPLDRYASSSDAENGAIGRR